MTTFQIIDDEVELFDTKEEYQPKILWVSASTIGSFRRINKAFSIANDLFILHSDVAQFGAALKHGLDRAFLIDEWARTNQQLNYIPSDDDCFKVIEMLYHNQKNTNEIINLYHKILTESDIFSQLNSYDEDFNEILGYQLRLRKLLRAMRLTKYAS